MTNDEKMTNDKIRTEKWTPHPGPLPFGRGEGEYSRPLGIGFRTSDFFRDSSFGFPSGFVIRHSDFLFVELGIFEKSVIPLHECDNQPLGPITKSLFHKIGLKKTPQTVAPNPPRCAANTGQSRISRAPRAVTTDFSQVIIQRAVREVQQPFTAPTCRGQLDLLM